MYIIQNNINKNEYTLIKDSNNLDINDLKCFYSYFDGSIDGLSITKSRLPEAFINTNIPFDKKGLCIMSNYMLNRYFMRWVCVLLYKTIFVKNVQNIVWGFSFLKNKAVELSSQISYFPAWLLLSMKTIVQYPMMIFKKKTTLSETSVIDATQSDSFSNTNDNNDITNENKDKKSDININRNIITYPTFKSLLYNEDVVDWDTMYYYENTDISKEKCGIVLYDYGNIHKRRKIAYEYIPVLFQYKNKNTTNTDTISGTENIINDNITMFIRYSILNDIRPKYTIIPYKYYPYLHMHSQFSKFGEICNITIEDMVLFPNDCVKIVESIASVILDKYDKNIDDTMTKYISKLYDIRKLVCMKPDYGRNVRYILEFMYNVYTYDINEENNGIPLAKVYEDFENYGTWNFTFEIMRDIPPEKFEVIARYLGFHIKDSKLYDRKKRGTGFGVYKRKIEIAPSITHEKIKSNTSYRAKRNLQFRSEPIIEYVSNFPWVTSSHGISASSAKNKEDYGMVLA